MTELRDLDADVLVVGSGGAGLTAAIMAHDRGAKVAVLERTRMVGGTTAVSGGGVWVPVNEHMGALGISDSRDEALTYCRTLAEGKSPDELLETFVDTAQEMARYLEQHTPLTFTASRMPDYRPEEAGAKPAGRTLQAEMFRKAELGDWEDKLRPSPLMFVPMTIEESFQGFAKPAKLPVSDIVERMKQGVVASGNALVGRLLLGCLQRGITIALGARARELLREDERVVGLRAEVEGSVIDVSARGGVVLASGGFEWSDDLRTQYMPGPLTHHCSPSSNTGDGLLMALAAGADLGNMSEAWGYPGAMVPGEEHDGRPVSRWVVGERTLPHSIMVNRFGERFVNEGLNYNDMSKAFVPDTHGGDVRNLPCWAIVDSRYRANYPILTVMPTDPDPEWLPQGDSLAGLAARLGINAEALQATVERWNGLVAAGKDADFGRGGSVYEHWLGDPDAPHPNLGSIEQPPFFALAIDAHSAGTKGGPRTNSHAQVLNKDGSPIPGLYAAGNVMAGISGPGYFGGGGTIAPAMTWGYLAGIHAAESIRTAEAKHA